MIPRLTVSSAISQKTKAFLKLLHSDKNFKGEIDEAFSSRIVASTDNSVYQVIPQAIVFPKGQTDIQCIFNLAEQKQFHDITFSPRGGGTGTNGQSLCSGIIIDCSKYMNRILELNLEEGWVVVEPGVVLDQLNASLKPHNKFFAPTLSPSNRATLGGMVNTDASGKGSRLYGKTSEHVLEITSVFPDGRVHTSRRIAVARLAKMKSLPGRVGKLYQQLEQTVNEHKETIAIKPVKLDRFVTGYNLDRIYSADGNFFNLNSVLTGSEGTLAVVTKIKLRLTDVPKTKCLFIVLYETFNDALEHAKLLVQSNPAAIETIDGTVLRLAKSDINYPKVEKFLSAKSGIKVEAINLIEFVAQDEEHLNNQIQILEKKLKGNDFYFIDDKHDIQNLWDLRKRSVGLLGKIKGARKPISGVEDTVVPPEHLADFIKEFRSILDAHNLQYGMFGHIDVGCLHVRPAFNLMDAQDCELYYKITNEVANLTKKYGGVLWGEHGKGFRSEFVPFFFGDELYQELRKIKAACDPYNQLNPHKIAVPTGVDAKLAQVNSNDIRANFDKQISDNFKEAYSLALSCNGNGACFNYRHEDVMCPSYKVTRNRIHSPKGRASLIREWVRQLSVAQSENSHHGLCQKFINSWHKKQGQYDFSHEVYEAMDGCLACQACKSQCPVNIDVPSFKAKFLEKYHSRYFRSLKNYLVAYSEQIGYFQSQFPKITNAVLSNGFVKYTLNKFVGLVDPPLFSSPNLNTLLKQHNIPILNLDHLPKKNNTVVFLQDWVTSFYEADLVIKCCLLIQKLGYQVYVMPWFTNGKTMHITGMLRQFEETVLKNVSQLEKITDAGLPIIGLDPAMVLTFRFEYAEFAPNPINYNVFLLQEWLSIASQRLETSHNEDQTYYLLSHCTEQANCNQAQNQWQKTFKSFGLKLEPKQVGCCGMAGSYGHETKKQAESNELFDLTWKQYFMDPNSDQLVLVDGYSCRAQVLRFTGIRAKHPIEVLLNRPFTLQDAI